MAGGEFWTLPQQAAAPEPGCFPREGAKSFSCQWDAQQALLALIRVSPDPLAWGEGI